MTLDERIAENRKKVYSEIDRLGINYNGGRGSGNFGHGGRPGKVGGSGPSKGIKSDKGKLPAIDSDAPEGSHSNKYTIYHLTTEKHKKSIEKSGLLTSKGKVSFSEEASGLVYASMRLTGGYLSKYGSTVVKIKPKTVRLPDISSPNSKTNKIQREVNRIGKKTGHDPEAVERFVRDNIDRFYEAGLDAVYAPRSWGDDIVYIFRDIAPNRLELSTAEEEGYSRRSSR